MADVADTEGTPASPGVFSRPASGLIRVAGSWDVFIFNVGLVSVGIAIALNQYYGPSLYPGVAVWLSTLLATRGDAVRGGHLLRLVDDLPPLRRRLRIALPRRQPRDRLRLVVDGDDHPHLLRGAGLVADRHRRPLLLLRHHRLHRRERDLRHLGGQRGQSGRDLLDRDGGAGAGRGAAHLGHPPLLHGAEGHLRGGGAWDRRAGRGDALRQPGHLRGEPRPAHRVGVPGGDRNRPRQRLGAVRVLLGHHGGVPGVAAAPAARRSAVDRDRRRGQAGSPLPAVRDAGSDRRHRSAHRPLRRSGEQRLRLRLPGGGRLQLAQRSHRCLHRGDGGGGALVHRPRRDPHRQHPAGGDHHGHLRRLDLVLDPRRAGIHHPDR